MESLTQEQDKLVQMGTIKYTTYKSLSPLVLNQAEGNNKSKDLKQQEKKNREKPKYLYGGSNPSKDKGKNKEKTKYTYFHKIWHRESAWINKTIDMMSQLLENNNILLRLGTRKKEGTLNS